MKSSRNLEYKETYPDHVPSSTVGQAGYGFFQLNRKRFQEPFIFTYFDDNNTESITIKDASQSLIDSFTYTYDANKNVTGETRGGVMSGYSWTTDNSGAAGYDHDDRLTYWKHTNNSQTQSWNLSLVGDWNSTTINGTLQNRTHNAVHELTAVGGTPLTYDVKGNLTTNTNGHAYTWDFDNRLSTTLLPGGAVVAYEYDALGRRVRKNNGTANTVYVLSGWQVIAEYASGAAPASPSEQYVYASYIDEPILKTGTGGAVYYSRNRQYSITALTNSTGSPVERYAYESHGKLGIFNASAAPISATQYTNPYTYTGRQFEPETGLYFFRTRIYDPALGRFISRDPLEFIDGVNRYRAYFVPDELDPSGTHRITFACNCSAAQQATVLKAWSAALAGADSVKRSIALLFDDSFTLEERQLIFHKFRIFFEEPTLENPNRLGEKPTLKVIDITVTIQGVIKNTADGMSGKPVTVYCDGRSCHGKYSYHHDPAIGYSSIVFCSKFFDSDGRAQAGLAFHEASHKWGGTEDYGYVTGAPIVDKNSDLTPDYEQTVGRLFNSRLQKNASTYEKFLWKFFLK